MNEAIETVLDFLEELAGLVQDIVNFFTSLFDVDFSILYDWLPSDISNAYTVIIGLLIILAFFGVVKRILMR